MAISSEKDIIARLINNDSLFNKMFVFHQDFEILPDDKKHYGASIAYQDLSELKGDFLNELYDTIVDWVYGSEKYNELKKAVLKKGKSESSANSEIQRKAREKFRKSENGEELLIQGQLGELLLFHFIQRFFRAAPLLRKMKITTSKKHERFGADAIHFKFEDHKPIVVLGEAKTYTSKYRFTQAFEDALESILTTYTSHREELNLYVHEDFLDSEMNEIAESYLNNTLSGVQVQLVSIVVYNETKPLNQTTEEDIKKQIQTIIEERYKGFENSKIDIKKYPILKRITYIVLPIWELDQVAKDFQNKL